MSISRNRLVTNNKYKEEENTYYFSFTSLLLTFGFRRMRGGFQQESGEVAKDITWFTCTNLSACGTTIQGVVFFLSLNAFKCLFYFQNVYEHTQNPNKTT